MTATQPPWKIIGILAVTQIISWGSLFYAFSILAPQIQRELGWHAGVVFGAFTWSLLVAGLTSTPAGILLDRFGGRYVMGFGSLACGAGLIILSLAKSVATYYLAWTVIGMAMALVLYEAAFATINREFAVNPRKGISTLTLFGGLASTVFWPLTVKLNGILGWRDTYLLYGALHLMLCAPLHALLGSRHRKQQVAGSSSDRAEKSHTLQEALRTPSFWKLAFAFAANAFIFSTMSIHLIPLLTRMGHSMSTIVFIAAAIGPMQVIGRITEMTLARNAHPETVGKVTFSILPAALLTLLLLGAQLWAAALFCALYGVSNGVLTIVKGTVPQALFGRQNYGAIAGAMAAPSMIALAAGPLVMASVMETYASPYPLLGILLAVSVLSFGAYIAAVNARPVSLPGSASTETVN